MTLKLRILLPLLMLIALGASAQAGTYDVRTFGAVGDGKTLNTKAIQATNHIKYLL